MALYDTTSGAHGATRGESFLSGLVARVRTWQRARATAQALKALTPAQLADIGIEPSDIDGFADRLARHAA